MVTTLAVTGMLWAWIFSGRLNEDMLRVGWMNFLYQLPLANAVFMPLLGMIVSSQLCDIEHKGNMLRVLAVVMDKGRIYDIKLAVGMTLMMLSVLLSWAATIVFGYAKGFAGDVPVRLYLLYLLFTAAPTAAVYIFQHTLALCLPNQAAAFFVGIIGAFAGLFSMFLPQFPWLRKSLLWGYYGALQFVGLFGWSPETRYRDAYFEVLKIDWPAFAVLIGACLVMYLAGRAFFVKKEV